MEEKNELILQERDYSTQILGIIRSDSTDEEIKTQLQEYHENDIASIFEELETEERDKLLQILGSELMSEIVSYLEDAGEYLSEIDADDAAEIIEQMDADDAAEVLEDLDEETRSEIFELIEDEEIKEDIELIDSYDDDEFGSRMSTNFIAVKRNSTIKETMRTLVSEAAENDNIYTIFVVNEDDSFYGVIDLKDLIVARSFRSNIQLSEVALRYHFSKSFNGVGESKVGQVFKEAFARYRDNTVLVTETQGLVYCLCLEKTRVNSFVGIDQTVNAEVAIVRVFPEVAAVQVVRIIFLVFSHGNGMVGKLPNASAEEVVVLVNKLLVVLKITGAVTHSVAVFA